MTHEMCSSRNTSPIKKYGIIQTTPVAAITRLKDPPTWLKVATTLENPPTPHPLTFLELINLNIIALIAVLLQQIHFLNIFCNAVVLINAVIKE